MRKTKVVEILGSIILIIFWYPKNARFYFFFRPENGLNFTFFDVRNSEKLIGSSENDTFY